MIKKKWKVFSLLSTIVIILILIVFANFELLLEDIMVLVAGEGTVYASKYDEDIFWQISNGMTKSEVLFLLGEPLAKSGDNQKYWNYSNQKKKIIEEGSLFSITIIRSARRKSGCI